jgi:hypothetical protein
MVMLSKVVSPNSKQELIRSLQSASIRSVEVFEGEDVSSMPSNAELIRNKATIIVLR